MAFRSSNPVLNEKTFNIQSEQTELMTLDGTTNKIAIFFLIVVLTASYSWYTVSFTPILYPVFIWGGIIGGLIFALITTFKKEWAAITGSLYCVCEGLFLGAISLLFEKMFPGIVWQAILLTFGVVVMLLFIYKTKIIKVTHNFRMGVMAATGAIALVYIVSIIGSFVGFQIPFIHEAGLIGIIFSVIVVVIASMNLILDFDFIENASGHAPKYMEWYGAFGLMVTLIWLYYEILRLLSKLRSR